MDCCKLIIGGVLVLLQCDCLTSVLNIDVLNLKGLIFSLEI